MTGVNLPYTTYQECPVDEMKRRAAEFYADIQRRLTYSKFDYFTKTE